MTEAVEALEAGTGIEPMYADLQSAKAQSPVLLT